MLMNTQLQITQLPNGQCPSQELSGLHSTSGPTHPPSESELSTWCNLMTIVLDPARSVKMLTPPWHNLYTTVYCILLYTVYSNRFVVNLRCSVHFMMHSKDLFQCTAAFSLLMTAWFKHHQKDEDKFDYI